MYRGRNARNLDFNSIVGLGESMDFTITLEAREVAVLTAIANKAGVEPAQYAKNIIKNFLKGQIVGIYQREFNKKTIPELVELFGEIMP